MLKKLVGIALLAFTLSLAGCGDDPPDNGPQDAGSKTDGSTTKPDSGETCDLQCGLDCCEPGQVCKDGVACCTPDCDGKECGSDGCGGTCGQCEGDETCSAAGKCETECTRETPQEFCKRREKNCGSVTAPDNCENEWTVNCGTCPDNGECDLTTNTCKECVYEGDNAFCYRMGKQCGAATGTDNCEQERTVEDCGPCGTGMNCNENGLCVQCTQTSNEQFCQVHAAECGSLTAMECGANRTVDCEPFGVCTGSQVCQNNRCVVPGAPANDDCAGAEVLNFVSGIATASGDTSLATDSYTADCAGSGAVADVVYTFTITEPKDVRATMTASWDEVIYITNACPVTGSTQEEVCDDEPGEVEKRLPAGTYYVWADGYFASSKGAFSLEVELTDPPPVPGNDLCADAVELQFGGSDSVSVPGTTLGAFDDDAGTCGTTDGGEVFYWFEITGTDNRSLTATVTPTGTGYRPAVYIRQGDCTTSTQVACNRAGSTGSNAVASAASLVPGVYYVVVDGVGSTGDFTLDLQLGAELILPEDCTSAQPLVFTSGTATITGDTSSASNESSGSCGSSSTQTAPDLVYSFTIDPSEEPMDVRAVVTPSGWDAIIYLTDACPATSDLGCSDTFPDTVKARMLPAGTYYLWIDGYSTASGPFSLTVDLIPSPPAPPGDNCTDAIPLLFTDGNVTVTGDTSTAYHDYRASCSSSSSTAPDLVYSFTIDAAEAPMNLSAVLDSPNWDAVIYLTDTCPPTGTLQCKDTPETLSLNSLPAGDYYIWIDGWGTGSGPFSLEVDLTPPPPGDTCQTAHPLSFDAAGHASISSSNAFAQDDFKGCGGTGGKDLVYSFSIDPAEAPMDLRAVLDTPSWDAVIFLTDTCPPTGALQCRDEPETLSLNSLPAGDYYIWVDGYSTGTGNFTLEVDLTQSPPPPDNDSCAVPELLDISGGSVSVSGQTGSAVNDYEGTCSGTTSTTALTGGDVVYEIELLADSSLAVRVTTSDGFKPGVYLRAADCTSGTEVACHRATSNNGTAMVIQPSISAGTYYLFVDGVDGQGGNFDLTVITGAVGTVPDDCTTAETIDVSSGTALVIGDTTSATQSGNSTCSTSTYQDVVYTFTTSEVKNFEAKVQFASTSYGPNLYLRKSACDSTLADDEVACAKLTSGGKLTLSAPGLPADTYWLWVDHPYSGEKGPFVLEVNLTDPLANDICSGAEALTLTQDPTSLDMIGTVTGTTIGAFDSGSGYCGGSAGADVMYSFEINAEQTVEILVTPTQGSTLKPLVHLRATTCDDAQAEVPTSCAESAATAVGGPASILVPRLQPGTYFVWVDAQSSSAGAFELTVTTRDPDPAPDNDACDGTTLDLTGLTTTIEGDTTFALDSATGSCGGAGSGDVVYSFTIPAGMSHKMTATVTPATATPNFRPKLYLRSVCASADAADQVSCADTSVVVNALDEGTYFLIVDGDSGSYGAFSLTVTLEDPFYLNDTCADAYVLTAGVPHSGDTRLGADDYGNLTFPTVCDGPLTGTQDGPELVYAFTPTLSGIFTIDIDDQYDSSVWVSPVCAATSGDPEAACIAAEDDSIPGPETLTVNGTVGTTYYIFVDGYSPSSKGTYTITVTEP